MVAALIFYSIGLVIPIVVGLREAFPSSTRLRLVRREVADLF